MAGALGVGGGLGLDGLGRVLGLVRRVRLRRSPIAAGVALVGSRAALVHGMSTVCQDAQECQDGP